MNGRKVKRNWIVNVTFVYSENEFGESEWVLRRLWYKVSSTNVVGSHMWMCIDGEVRRTTLDPRFANWIGVEVYLDKTF